MIITRNKKLDKLINELKNKNLIELTSIKPERIVEAQKPQKKIELLNPYFKVSKLFGKGTPYYKSPTLDHFQKNGKSSRYHFRHILDYLCCKSTSNFITRIFINRVPIRLLRRIK